MQTDHRQFRRKPARLGVNRECRGAMRPIKSRSCKNANRNLLPIFRSIFLRAATKSDVIAVLAELDSRA